MKILKTLYTATLCAAMAVSTSSCLNSWLDQSPADGIDAETAIKNSDDLAKILLLSSISLFFSNLQIYFMAIGNGFVTCYLLHLASN